MDSERKGERESGRQSSGPSWLVSPFGGVEEEWETVKASSTDMADSRRRDGLFTGGPTTSFFVWTGGGGGGECNLE